MYDNYENCVLGKIKLKKIKGLYKDFGKRGITIKWLYESNTLNQHPEISAIFLSNIRQ